MMLLAVHSHQGAVRVSSKLVTSSESLHRADNWSSGAGAVTLLTLLWSHSLPDTWQVAAENIQLIKSYLQRP